MLQLAPRWGLIVVALVMAACGAPVFAQAPADPHAAQPERPSVATHAGTVAPGWIELETGGEFDRYADHARGGTTPTLLKIGAASHVQLDMAGAYVSAPGDGAGSGVGDLTVGVKWRLLDHAPVLGRFAIQPRQIAASDRGRAGLRQFSSRRPHARQQRIGTTGHMESDMREERFASSCGPRFEGSGLECCATLLATSPVVRR